MKKGIRYSILIFGSIVLLLFAFALGESMGQRAMLSVISMQLTSTQASLAFNRLLDDRRFRELLAKGCVRQATNAIDVSEDEDMALLADFSRKGIDESAKKYIADRAPQLLEQLKTFKSKYQQGYVEEECK